MLLSRLLLVTTLPLAAAPTLTFKVSMEKPAAHTFHVELRAEGLRGSLLDFKMPQWTSGFYRIQDYERYVSNFHASDGAGHPFAWEKTARNTWRVIADDAPLITLDYDVYGATAFAASNYLGEDRAFLLPSGLFVHPAGQLALPVTIELQPPDSWHSISTGLDAVPGKHATFTAPDFDVLYDCPILIGAQERLEFAVGGVPHYVAIENVPASVSRPQMLSDLRSIVTAATQLIGDIPYRHYTFLMMGRGGGGIEHSNSSANQFNGQTLTTPAGYLRWLSFIAHEYFHNFNVKRIRPLALGPFDYDQEALTDLLWVSEGLSVYYQDLLLVRAGLMSRQQYLDKMAAALATFENADGRNYQSATESSQNTWNTGSGVGGDRNITISYYNNGSMLGAMLDLDIRAASANRHSLDDAMRALYAKYYVKLKRGFTAAEFRAECEAAAGSQLDDIFTYASTTREVDYARHFALAGLRLDLSTEPASGGYIGLHTSTSEIAPAEVPPSTGRPGPPFAGAPSYRLMVTDTVPNSPAFTSGLQSGDRIVSVDGVPASAAVLEAAIRGRTVGQSLNLKISRASVEHDVAVTIAQNRKRVYKITPDQSPSAEQKAILDTWLAQTCCSSR